MGLSAWDEMGEVEWGVQAAAGANFTLPPPGRRVLQPVQRAEAKVALRKLAATWDGRGRRCSTAIWMAAQQAGAVQSPRTHRRQSTDALPDARQYWP